MMRTPMMVAVRGYAIAVRDGDNEVAAEQKPKKRKALPKPSKEALIFDCETTSDHAQSLRFGTYQCRKRGELVEVGLFYETDNPKALSASDLLVIQNYATKRGLVLRTRDSFIQDIFYKYAYAYGALVVGFNLPFDISRLATSIGTAHARDMRGGFTFKLSQLPHHPNVVIKHLNARASFIRFAATGQMDSRSERKRGDRKRHRVGYFQDVKTLAAALLGKGHTLKSLAETLGTEHRKQEAKEHGCRITPRYLDYGMTDTQVTWECYEKLFAIYEAHGLKDTPAHRIYSEASLGKAYLRHMGIFPLRKVQPDIPPALLGQIMGTYYGGRAEVRIRRQIAQVQYSDFRSMYPTVCTLMGLWRFVIAEGFDWSDWTSEAQALLDGVQLSDLQNKPIWQSLAAIVQIEPDDDILPVRAAYDGKSRTIGLNYLSAGFPMWFTLADCITSKILTGRAPKVISALKFTPRAIQQGIKPIKIAGRADLVLDPAHNDFFRELIIRRGHVQGEFKAETDLHKRELLDAQQMMLKLLANSTSYGIYAEQNAQSQDRPRDVDLFGHDSEFRTRSTTVEEPGTHFHPLIATLITGAARLMLACAERGAELNGIGWAFCDTDSLALARPDWMGDGEFLQRCADVTNWFDQLDPYGDGKPLFKVEDQNFALSADKPTERHCPLYALAISAKRYVLFNLAPDRKPIIRKALAHGLGHLMEPYGDKDAPKSIPLPPHGLARMDVKRWQHDLWHHIVAAFLAGHPDSIELPRTRRLDQPARSRYGATTPALLRWFRHFNRGKPLSEQVKPFNFMCAFTVSKVGFAAEIAHGHIDGEFIDNGLPSAVAPYDDDPIHAATNSFDRNTSKPVSVSILKTYREAMADYAWHPESKFENAERDDTGITQRRHIEAIALEYIGKEANRLEERFFLGELPEAQIEYGRHPGDQQRLMTIITQATKSYGIGNIAREAQMSRQQLHAILSGESLPKRKTVLQLNRAIASLANAQQA